MASLRAVHGSERILNKLFKLIDSAEYYEAHQMYRTIYFRYLNAKRYKDLENLLFNGAILLLERNQYNSGADLGVLYIETLSQDGDIKEALQDPKEYNQLCENIGKIMSLIPPGTPERLNFTLTTLKLKPSIFPIPLIHREFAIITWRERNFTDSRYHFLHCSFVCSEECASMLIEYHVTCGYPSEVDLFIAQFILQLLCLKKINFSSLSSQSQNEYRERCLSSTQNEGASSAPLADSLNLAKVTPKSSQHAFANLTLQYYLAKHPQIKESNPSSILPLINFLWFLLLAIEGGKSSSFTLLCELYSVVLKRDPSYKEYLIRIGELYFGIKPPQNRSGFGGFINNFLQSFMEEGDEEMVEDENSSNTQQSNERQSATQQQPRSAVGGEDLD